MAYQVRYQLDDTDVSSEPYADWLACCSIRDSAFMFSKRCLNDRMYTVFVPAMNIMYMNIQLEYWIMEAFFLVNLCHEKNIVNFTACSCSADNLWQETYPASPHGQGSIAFFKRCMRSLTSDFTKYMVHPFLGDTWKINMRSAVRSEVLLETQNAFNEMQEHFTVFKYNSVIGHFDDTRELAAATKIKATFRGWRERMKYRFNPYTTLGQHLALKLYIKE